MTDGKWQIAGGRVHLDGSKSGEGEVRGCPREFGGDAGIVSPGRWLERCNSVDIQAWYTRNHEGEEDSTTVQA